MQSKGLKEKKKNRKINNRPKYRSGKQSLSKRVEKKLTEKENWFRKKRNSEEEDKEEEKEKDKDDRKRPKWSHYKSKKERIVALEDLNKEESPAKAVMFVQNTVNSELAGQIRKLIIELKP